MNVRLVYESSNRKTGPIPCSYSSQETCPLSCPWFSKGCYANDGQTAIHWRATREGNYPWEKFLEAVRAFPKGQLWRHNVAGDLPGVGDYLNAVMLEELVEANYHRKGFTYTHKPLPSMGERIAVRQANLDGFTINLSADSPEHADRLADLGIAPVTMVLPVASSQLPRSDRWLRTPAGRPAHPGLSRPDLRGPVPGLQALCPASAQAHHWLSRPWLQPLVYHRAPASTFAPPPIIFA